MSNKKKILSNQLISISSAVDAMLFLLDSLDDDLSDKVVKNDEVDECLHPREARQNMMVMGGGVHWICSDCGYEYQEEK